MLITLNENRPNETYFIPWKREKKRRGPGKPKLETAFLQQGSINEYDLRMYADGMISTEWLLRNNTGSVGRDEQIVVGYVSVSP